MLAQGGHWPVLAGSPQVLMNKSNGSRAGVGRLLQMKVCIPFWKTFWRPHTIKWQSQKQQWAEQLICGFYLCAVGQFLYTQPRQSSIQASKKHYLRTHHRQAETLKEGVKQVWRKWCDLGNVLMIPTERFGGPQLPTGPEVPHSCSRIAAILCLNKSSFFHCVHQP